MNTETFGRPQGKDLTISRQQRKIDQLQQTVEHLHERLARVQSSKSNKASQIARLKKLCENPATKLLADQAVTIAKSGVTVSIHCDGGDGSEADLIFNWLGESEWV